MPPSGKRSAAPLEQTPAYTLNTLDDGRQDRLQLVVQLPGVLSASELEVRLREDLISVRVPGRYDLELPLSCHIKEEAEKLNFVKKKSVLKAEFLVVHDPTKSKRQNPLQSLPPDEDTQAPSPDARPRNTPSAPPEARPAVHNSFLDEAIKLRDSRKGAPSPNPQAEERPPPNHLVNGAIKPGIAGARGAVDPVRARSPKTARRAESISENSTSSGQGTNNPPSPRSQRLPRKVEEAAQPIPQGSRNQVPQPSSKAATKAAEIQGAAAQGTAHRVEANAAHRVETNAAQRVEDSAAHRVEGNGAGYSSQEAFQKGFLLREGALQSSARGPSLPREPSPYGGREANSFKRPLGTPSTAEVAAESTWKTPSPRDRVSVSYENAELSTANREAAEEFHARAQAAAAVENLDDAIRLLRKATQLDPANPAYLESLAAVLRKRNGSPGSSPLDEETADPAKSQPKQSKPEGSSRPTSGKGEKHQKPGRAGKGKAPPQKAEASARPKPAESAKAEDERPDSAGPSSPSFQRGSAEASPGPLRSWRLYAASVKAHGVFVIHLILPLLADQLGYPMIANWLDDVFEDTDNPYHLLKYAFYVMVVMAAAVPAAFFTLLGVRLSLMVWRGGIWSYVVWPFEFTLWVVRTVLIAVFWHPPWYIAIVISYWVAVEEWDSLSLCILWPFPVMWWLTGGRWWSLFGSPIAFALSIVFHIQFYISTAFIVLIHEFFVWLPWWAASLATLLAAFACIFFTVEAERSSRQDGVTGKLQAEVPEGAVGEVARVLSCTDYYEVLEVERTADEGAVRRAKRSKALLVHPDKLTGNAAIGAAEAFHRITEAHDVLADAKARQKYDRELVEADRAEQARKAYEEDPDNMEGLMMACPRCEHRHGPQAQGHLVVPTSRPLHKARWCGEHKEYGPRLFWTQSKRAFFLVSLGSDHKL
eukprot:jgi/Botrbrau1/23154/Bobra.0041s0006.2